MKRWKKIPLTNNNPKRAGVAVLISDKIDFKSRKVIRDKEGYINKMFNLTSRYNNYKHKPKVKYSKYISKNLQN